MTIQLATTATPDYSALLEQTLKTIVRWTRGVGILKVNDASPLAQLLDNPKAWSTLQAKLSTLLQYADFLPNPQQTYETIISWYQPGPATSDIHSTINQLTSAITASLPQTTTPSWLVFNRMPSHVFELAAEECMKVPRVRDNAE